jgi:ABC-type branched-subunit amino acid transport system ATPase component
MPTSTDESPLRAEAIEAGYGRQAVLHGLSVAVRRGQVVALVGHNASGKSTLLKALYGTLPLIHGTVSIDGHEIRPEPRRMMSLGVGFVPQSKAVFNDLTVEENLRIAALPLLAGSASRRAVARVFATTPLLAERRYRKVETLSGGERQMLALAATLLLEPRILLLDEPTLGLAAPVASAILHDVRKLSRDRGTAVLIAEQKVSDVLGIADHVVVLRRGTVSFSGPSVELTQDILRERFFN